MDESQYLEREVEYGNTQAACDLKVFAHATHLDFGSVIQWSKSVRRRGPGHAED